MTDVEYEVTVNTKHGRLQESVNRVCKAVTPVKRLSTINPDQAFPTAVRRDK